MGGELGNKLSNADLGRAIEGERMIYERTHP